MIVDFTPQRRDDRLEIDITGDRIRINGELFNFNPVPEGGRIAAEDIPCEWFAGPVTRLDGQIWIKLIQPHGPNPTEEE